MRHVSSILRLSLERWHNIFRVRRSTLVQFILIPKEKLCTYLTYVGLLLAMLGSLNPWFLWPVNNKYPLLSALFLIPALLVAWSRKQDTIFTRKGLFLALCIFVIYEFYIQLVNDQNIFGFIVALFHIQLVYVLFKLNRGYYEAFMTLACKFMALLLLVSFTCFTLHLFGFPFPSCQAVFGENQYSYTNYYFFMLDNRTLYEIIPRFSSVFLEPGHLGTATIMLLLTQMGRWRKWYNVILWIVTFVTFSLAAYVFAVALMVLNSWVQRRKILAKIIAIACLVASVGVGSIYYNKGDNMIHNLIMLRLEVDERTGDLSGNNRVTDSFKREYESFLSSSDLWFGRSMPKNDTGNSGYRVFIYDNGLCALFFVLVLYVLMYKGIRDKRSVIAAWSLAILAFYVRGYPLWYSNFIPCFMAGYRVFEVSQSEIERNDV